MTVTIHKLNDRDMVASNFDNIIFNSLRSTSIDLIRKYTLIDGRSRRVIISDNFKESHTNFKIPVITVNVNFLMGRQ